MDSFADKTVYGLFLSAAAQYPDATAITYIDNVEGIESASRLSFSQLLSKLHRAVQMMRLLTGKSRPVVSLLLPNFPQSQILLWGAEIAGVANPLNPLLNEESLFQLMLRAGTDLIFALGPVPGSDLWSKALSVSSRLPNKPVCVSVLNSSDALHFDSEVESFEDIKLCGENAPRSGDVAAYFHTGGTTGIPKLACHTHGNQFAAALAVIRSMQLTSADIAINGLPIFHVAGAIVNSLAVLSAGGQLVLPTLAGFRNQEVIRQHWRIIENLRVTITSAIPTSMASMLDVPVGNINISSLRFLLSGGAPVPLKLHELAVERLGRQLYQAYGMTETSGVIALPNIAEPSVRGSVGHIFPPTEVCIKSGEICVRSPMVFPGYLGGDSPLTSDGWLKTGDLGRLDDAGNLYITGRAKDLIIRSGHNIDPALIENCLEQHSAVSVAAAVGMPDEYAGELPMAFVQLREGVNVSSDELRAYAIEHIAERPACPKRVVILETLPVTAVGKVFKPRLREMAADMILEELLTPYLGSVGIRSRHLDTGQLVVKLWGVPEDKYNWCCDQVALINMVVEDIAP